jgi:DNA-binding NarL/FixJ family response regulator
MNADGFRDFLREAVIADVLTTRFGSGLPAFRTGLQQAYGLQSRSDQLAGYLALKYRLSDREVQVMDGIVHGKSNGLIASELGISAETVNEHVDHLFEKTGASSRGELTGWIIDMLLEMI